MSEIRIGQAAALLGVSADTVRRLADDGTLATRRTAGGHRVVDGATLAAYARDRAPEPEEVAIAGQSARNRFPGIVTRVERDGVMALVELQAGPHRVVSLISREAADELGLAPGVLAVAAVKSTSVMIEVPE
jgi:molybdopterin-binding protein